MEANDDPSDGECSFDLFDNDYCHSSSGINIQLKKDPKVWLARNPGRLWEVGTLKLELPDDVYNIPDSIWKLYNLINLNIIKSLNLKCLLDRLPTLRRLHCLKLENCPNLSELPRNLSHIASLKFIIIRNCGIKSLPDSLSQLELAVLELSNCQFIQELPANLNVGIIRVGCAVKRFSDTPSFLRSLEINCCSYAADILTVLKDYDSLQTLQIKGCDMECFPDSISGICSLEELEIINCMNLKTLPENVGQFVDLYRLNLVNCGIKYLCSGLCNLKSLLVNNCPMEFHVLKDCVTTLTYLEIIDCCVKSLHGCVTGLTNLTYLRLSNCKTMEDLPTGINTSDSLEELCIEGCSSIKFLPNLAALHKLRKLSLRCCFSLNELPDEFDKLTSLSSLFLMNTNIESLPSTITKLDKLRDLYLPRCFRFETLPDDLDLNLIRVVISPFFRLNKLPTKFSVKADYLGY